MTQHDDSRSYLSRQELLHLSALNAFALAQPVLDRLAMNPGYLWRRNISSLDVFATIAVLLTALPMACCLSISLLRWRGFDRAAEVFLKGSIGAFVFMAGLVAARGAYVTLAMGERGIPQSVLALTALVGAVISVKLYSRYEAIRTVLTICSCSVVLFPVGFFSSPAIQERVLGISKQTDVAIPSVNPSPIVMIVFDGLCGMALLNEQHEVDRARYPSFARLADSSHFYRNATTVHTRTDHAVPAILSSSIPSNARQPVEADYPTNLFRMIHRTQQYDMTVAEPVSHFYSALGRSERRRESTTVTQIVPLLSTLMTVYLDISIPHDLELPVPDIPREWFGMGRRPENAPARPGWDGEAMFGWDSDREVQCDQFVRSITSSDVPTLRFLHVVIPHEPWDLLPSGRSYVQYYNHMDSIAGSQNEEWTSDRWLVHQGWQRYLLQLKFADRTLGRILDRLEAIDQLDRSLIVVTADHGMAFAPGFNRRVPSAETLPDIASVPLLVKYPFQKQPEVSDRNVETIDILPTIADVLDLPVDGAWEGESLLKDRPDRPRKTLVSPPDTIVIEAEFAQRFRYVDRMIDVFGTETFDDRVSKMNFLPHLIGVRTADLVVGTPASYTTQLYQGGCEFNARLPNFIPCYLRGQLQNSPQDTTPRVLAIALNGVILATTRSSEDSTYHGEWSALIPEESFQPTGNKIRLFEVEANGDGVVLHEVTLQPIPS